jgi:hypothetical protein
VLASAPSIIKRQREKPVLRTGSNFDALELSLTHTTQTEENCAVSTVSVIKLYLNIFLLGQNRDLISETYVFEFSFDDLGSYYILA